MSIISAFKKTCLAPQECSCRSSATSFCLGSRSGLAAAGAPMPMPCKKAVPVDHDSIRGSSRTPWHQTYTSSVPSKRQLCVRSSKTFWYYIRSLNQSSTDSASACFQVLVSYAVHTCYFDVWSSATGPLLGLSWQSSQCYSQDIQSGRCEI